MLRIGTQIKLMIFWSRVTDHDLKVFKTAASLSNELLHVRRRIGEARHSPPKTEV